MKRILSALLAAVMIASLFTACTKERPPEKDPSEVIPPYEATHTLYFRDGLKSKKAVATFFNSKTGESVDIEMTKDSEDADAVTYSCEGDAERYNMVYVTCDDKKEEINRFKKVAFNPCVSGWYRTEEDLLPYTVGTEPDYRYEYDDITLKAKGKDRKIHVWKPDDYDPSSEEKYATVYVMDGQGFVYLGENGQKLKGCPLVNEQVRAMTASTGMKAIVVAIESSGQRDYEMVPEIGTSLDEMVVASIVGENLSDMYDENDMNGTEFAQFIAETVVPYIREHYNVYPNALRTSITGASLAGLESFYTAMEYPEVFGACGALSPSLWEYDDATWSAYLGDKSFGSDAPLLYLYTGPQENGDTDPDVTEMYNRLKGMGYPEEKLVLHFNEEGVHDSTIWRNVVSEFLTAMVYRQVKPLR